MQTSRGNFEKVTGIEDQNGTCPTFLNRKMLFSGRKNWNCTVARLESVTIFPIQSPRFFKSSFNTGIFFDILNPTRPALGVIPLTPVPTPTCSQLL